MSDREFFGQARSYAVMALISLAGLADAIFLTVEHLTGSVLTCVVSSGCSEVLASRYATIGSMPIAMLGAVAFFLTFSAATLAAFGHRWAGTFFTPPHRTDARNNLVVALRAGIRPSRVLRLLPSLRGIHIRARGIDFRTTPQSLALWGNELKLQLPSPRVCSIFPSPAANCSRIFAKTLCRHRQN